MNDHETHETAPEDRISLEQKLAYSVGMLVNNLQAAALPAMMVVLNLGLKISPIWVGIIGFVPRIVDAVTDPLMGYLSDHTRTRWGRRRPYIFVGALIAGLVFAGMWQLPPGHSQNFYIWFFMSASIAYFVAYTVYATPFVALGFEMSADYHERTRLQAFANTVGQIAWLLAPGIWMLIAYKEWFTDEAHGARVLALGVGAAICLLGVVPAIYCREKTLPESNRSTDSKSEAGIIEQITGFFGGILTTFQCRPFLKLCAATFLVFNGYILGTSFSLYVMIYYIFGAGLSLAEAKSAAGGLNLYFGVLTTLCTMVVIPLTSYLTTKLGKRRTFLLTISLSLIGYSLKWFGYNPDHPNWLLFSCPFIAFGTGSLFTLMGSMVADVCDYDELETHERREGVFGAIYWWMVKVGMALAGLLTGIMLEASGFDVNLGDQGIAQSDQTLYLLRVFDVAVPLACSVIALAVMSTYEISEERAHKIREELIARRGRLNTEDE